MLRYVYCESLLKYIKVTPRKDKTENGNFYSCDTTATHFKHEHNVTLGHSYDVSTSENVHLSPWCLAFNKNYLHQHVLYNLNVNWAGFNLWWSNLNTTVNYQTIVKTINLLIFQKSVWTVCMQTWKGGDMGTVYWEIQKLNNIPIIGFTLSVHTRAIQATCNFTFS